MHELDVVSFVNDGVKQKKREILKPILCKMLSTVFMVTIAMMLFYKGDWWIGGAIYVKEVLELVMFVRYLKGD